MKFIANHLVAIHNVAAAEAMLLAQRAGLDPKMVVDWSARAPAARACSRCARR